MRKLALPNYDPAATFRACVAEIGDAASVDHYMSNEPYFLDAVQRFDAESSSCSWYNLPRSLHGVPEQIVLGSLTKKELVDLYSDYMVAQKGASRDIYDEILISSDEICPFCGGLGQVKTLDHFLPKARYPSYSVLPANLFPCCRDCNTDKRASVPDQATKVSVNPYFDAPQFFTERWVVADLVGGTPLSITFRAAPPAHWTPIDKARAISHFENYGLAKRFSLQASGELGKVVNARKGELHVLPAQNYRNHLLDQANSEGLDLNGWSRTLYQTLADSAWFVGNDFRLPLLAGGYCVSP